jgi:hypothetical protein
LDSGVDTGFPSRKREAFAWRSCSKMELDRG